MADWSYLGPLVPDDYLVLNVGADKWVPLQCKRATLFDFLYDPVLQGALGGVLAPAGAAAGTGQVAAWQDNILLAISASATGANGTTQSINGVTDIFQVQQAYEVLQLWMGIAPKPTRFWLKQPIGAFVNVMDQNLVPTTNFPDVGFLDGYESPYVAPSTRSEWFSLANLSANFAFFNPEHVPRNPRFHIVVNRMIVRPVVDPGVIASLLRRTRPAKYASIGSPAVEVPFNGEPYGDIEPISPSVLDEPDVAGALADLGYCTKSKGGR